MIDLEKLTKQELNEALEGITFRNIIWMRRENLQRIIDGEKAIDVIPQTNQRRVLRRDGILVTTYKHGGRIIDVTPRARELLEEII